LQVEQAERVITRFQTQKTGVLLAYLAFNLQLPHSREVLTALLWPDDELDAARHKLRMALSSLRRQLEPPGVPAGAVIVSSRTTVQLNPEAVSTDMAEYESALQAAYRAGSNPGKARHLAEAVELYRGELLPGYYEDWMESERQRLEESYHRALAGLVDHLEQMGDLHRALDYARRAVTADPLREEAHGTVIRLLKAIGQPEAALRQYLDLERLLDEQLGSTPSAEILEVGRELRRARPERQNWVGGDEGTRLRRLKVRQTSPSPPRIQRIPGDSSSSWPLSEPSSLPGDPPEGLATGFPAGTLTFLVSEVVPLETPEAGKAAAQVIVEDCQSLLRSLIRGYGGHEIQARGATLQVAFGRASDALAAAVAGQQAAAAHPWPQEAVPLRIRMALHTGEVEPGEEIGHCSTLQLAVRLMQAAHPGQLLASDKTAAMLSDSSKLSPQPIDLGLYCLGEGAVPQRLYQISYPEMSPGEFPPPNTSPGLTSQLPLQITRFFGREAELAQLRVLLTDPGMRLVTITGPGGQGKTRLATEVARQLLESGSALILFVPLADLAHSALVPAAILDTARLPRHPQLEPLEQLVQALSGQKALLVLDNFEHLVEEGASVVRTLLERLPKLTCLVTSRQSLAIAEEHELPLLPLGVPREAESPQQLLRCESVRLFVDRAQGVRPDFQVTRANAEAVAGLCRRLEGLPLALELAAAWIGVITPAKMLARMEQRFELLVSRQRDAPRRHRTLQAAIDWSYQLLSPELQRFFARLSVFRGGWTLEAAEAVCMEPRALDYLDQLRRCSLVLADEPGEEPLFWMLESLQAYAAAQHGPEEQADLRRRHAEYYLTLAELAEPSLQGPDQQLWLDRLERAHHNLRAALSWARETGATETGLRLGGALWRFWRVRGYLSEGRKWLVEVLELAPASKSTPARARALHGAGVLACLQGDYQSARSLLVQSLAMARDQNYRQGVAEALSGLAMIAYSRGYYQAVSSLCEEALAVWRELGDQQGIARALDLLGNAALGQGDLQTARTLHEESLTLSRGLHDRHFSAACLNSFGDVARALGEYETARLLYEESLEIHREVGDKIGITGSLIGMGNVALYRGDLESAGSLFQESLRIRRELGDRRGIAECLEGLAAVAGGRAETEWAARLFGAAEALREGIDCPLPLSARSGHARHAQPGRIPLTVEEYFAAWREGSVTDVEQVIAAALGESAASRELCD
jgi:predicted ATPase/DNA-binding SARP family transcriptional activator